MEAWKHTDSGCHVETPGAQQRSHLGICPAAEGLGLGSLDGGRTSGWLFLQSRPTGSRPGPGQQKWTLVTNGWDAQPAAFVDSLVIVPVRSGR